MTPGYRDCRKCGHSVRNGKRVCLNCGTPTTAPSRPMPARSRPVAFAEARPYSRKPGLGTRGYHV